MTKTISRVNKELEKLDILDEIENYRGKWVNVYFTKKGIISGDVFYGSENEAITTYIEWIKHMDNEGGKFDVTDNNKNYLFTYPDEYITAIQMPVECNNG